MTIRFECHYAECPYAECRDYLNVMLSFITPRGRDYLNVMLSAAMLNAVMLGVVMLNVFIMSTVLPLPPSTFPVCLSFS